MSIFKKRTVRRRAGSTLLQTKTKKKQRQPFIPLPRQTIKAGDDFYTHINGDWLKHAHIPPFLSTYGASEELEEIIEDKLFNIIYSAVDDIKGLSKATGPKKLIGDYVQSIIHTPSQENNVRFIQSIVNKIACVRDKSELAATIGDLAYHRVSTAPFRIFNDPMETNSRKLYTAIAPGDLGLPDYDYYLDKSRSMRANTDAYVHLLSWLGKEFAVPKLESVIAIEKKAAVVLKRSDNDLEVFLSGASLKRRFKHFDWEAFAAVALKKTEVEFRTGHYLVKI